MGAPDKMPRNGMGSGKLSRQNSVAQRKIWSVRASHAGR
jgi:hypothetical protein